MLLRVIHSHDRGNRAYAPTIPTDMPVIVLVLRSSSFGLVKLLLDVMGVALPEVSEPFSDVAAALCDTSAELMGVEEVVEELGM